MKFEFNNEKIETETKFILSPIEIHKVVFEKAKNILEESGISTDKEIVVKEIKGDDRNSIFRIDYENSTFALKVFSNSASEFYTNIKFSKLAIENNIHTPKIIHSSDDNRLLPVPWILSEWAAGEPSRGIESKSDRFSAAVETGMQLRKLHEIEMPGYGYPNAMDEWSGENIKWTIDYFIKEIQELIKKGSNAFSENDLLKILSVTMESKELASFAKPRLLHGDINGGNFIVSKSENIIFIDPGEIISGDPMSDLGYSQTTRLSPIFREGIWKGYTDSNPLSEEEYDRFLRWRLLRQCVIACRAVLKKDQNAENFVNDTLLFLEEIQK